MKNGTLGNRVEYIPTIYEGMNMFDLTRINEEGKVELCAFFDLDYNFLFIPSTVWEIYND